MSRVIKTVITFGTFDLLHIGHINILRRAKALGDRLIVGVSTDEMNFNKKNIYPVYNEKDRFEIVQSICYVDGVFFEKSLDQKGEYIKMFHSDVLVMGDDWKGKFDHWGTECGCEVVYLERTDGISTTITKDNISCN